MWSQERWNFALTKLEDSQRQWSGHGFKEAKNVGSRKGKEGQNDLQVKEESKSVSFFKENLIGNSLH